MTKMIFRNKNTKIKTDWGFRKAIPMAFVMLLCCIGNPAALAEEFADVPQASEETVFPEMPELPVIPADLMPPVQELLPETPELPASDIQPIREEEDIPEIPQTESGAEDIEAQAETEEIPGTEKSDGENGQMISGNESGNQVNNTFDFSSFDETERALCVINLYTAPSNVMIFNNHTYLNSFGTASANADGYLLIGQNDEPKNLGIGGDSVQPDDDPLNITMNSLFMKDHTRTIVKNFGNSWYEHNINLNVAGFSMLSDVVMSNYTEEKLFVNINLEADFYADSIDIGKNVVVTVDTHEYSFYVNSISGEGSINIAGYGRVVMFEREGSEPGILCNVTNFADTVLTMRENVDFRSFEHMQEGMAESAAESETFPEQTEREPEEDLPEQESTEFTSAAEDLAAVAESASSEAGSSESGEESPGEFEEAQKTDSEEEKDPAATEETEAEDPEKSEEEPTPKQEMEETSEETEAETGEDKDEEMKENEESGAFPEVPVFCSFKEVSAEMNGTVYVFRLLGNVPVNAEIILETLDLSTEEYIENHYIRNEKSERDKTFGVTAKVYVNGEEYHSEQKIVIQLMNIYGIDVPEDSKLTAYHFENTDVLNEAVQGNKAMLQTVDIAECESSNGIFSFSKP